jgi:hypothetical protein
MNATDARLVELALKKQRLQFTSEQLRHRFARNVTFVQPLCAGFDRIRSAWHWLRQRPAIPVAIVVALLVGRPRGVWRWARRGFFAWQAWQRTRRMVESALKR